MAELLFTASVDRMMVDHDLSPRLFKSQRGRITQHTYRTPAPRSDIGRRSAPFHPLWSHGPVSVQQWASAFPSRKPPSLRLSLYPVDAFSTGQLA